jgi:hypothetical protein
MKEYRAESFVRHDRRVRSPVSKRRTQRLLRLSLVCGAALVLAVTLVVMSMR